VRETWGPISLVIQLGARVVVATLLPLIIGIWLDNQLHTIPWITLIAMVVGIVSAVASVYKVVSEQYRKSG
jgi:F0F1-type ATP synthase assembly protein I